MSAWSDVACVSPGRDDSRLLNGATMKLERFGWPLKQAKFSVGWHLRLWMLWIFVLFAAFAWNFIRSIISKGVIYFVLLYLFSSSIYNHFVWSISGRTITNIECYMCLNEIFGLFVCQTVHVLHIYINLLSFCFFDFV